MLIEIIDEFIEVKAGDKVSKVRIPTIEESNEYAANYDSAKTQKDKNKVLKEYLCGLGLDKEVYSKMRDIHLRQLVEGFSEKKV